MHSDPRTNLSSVTVMDSGRKELAAFMLPEATIARLRSFAAACGENQHQVVAAAIEHYMAARPAKGGEA